MIRLLLAGGISLAVSLGFTRLLIHWLVKNRIGQPIHEDVPEGHTTKAGTPTMGGTAIVSGALVGYVLSNLLANLVSKGSDSGGVYTYTGIFVMLAIAGAGLVGLLDDWIKVTNERNLGLNARSKMIGLFLIAVGLSVGLITKTGLRPIIAFTRQGVPDITIARWAWVIFAVLVITGMANAVNLTDGLDGLAAGAATLAFSAFVLIGFWQFRYPSLYGVEHALDLSVVAMAMMGGCIGFLWWNASPAQIFMGDTGSLAIGTALAGLAICTNTTLLLVIIGALFVGETVSVILQVVSFRTTGKRIFRMAPFHHHLELRGWPETRVIIRLWIVSGLCTALGLGLFYADFLGTGEARVSITTTTAPTPTTASVPTTATTSKPAATTTVVTAGTATSGAGG